MGLLDTPHPVQNLCRRLGLTELNNSRAEARHRRSIRGCIWHCAGCLMFQTFYQATTTPASTSRGTRPSATEIIS